MTIDNRHLLVAIVLVVGVAIVGGFVLTSWNGPDGPGQGSSSHNAVYFEGNVSTDDGLSVNGRLEMGGVNERQSRFENVSIRLYDANGSLLQSKCLGALVIGEPTSISLTSDREPAYVIFASQDFWQKQTATGFEVEYLYREEGSYYTWEWSDPTDLPINIRQDSPCRSDGGLF